MFRHALVLLTAFALACLLLPAPGAARDAVNRYIVELAPPAGVASAATAAPAAAALQSDALAAVARLTGAPAQPVYTYTQALSGFALDLTAAQAAAVAAMPGVARVVPDWVATLHGDAGPALVGAAQADQRPALFLAALSGVQAVPPAASGATGRAVAHYDAATQTLTLQLFYSGLSGPPSEATLRRAPAGQAGPVAADLAPFAVGAPAAAGGYLATLSLGAADEAALFAGSLALNLGTAAAPAGELRGQLAASRGEGVVIGVLDTGIDPAHPSFTDQPADGYVYTNPLGRYLGVCSPDDGDGRYDPSFPCNNKLIGAYTFADTAATPDPQGRPSPRDNNDHGSHVAGIAAGNLVPGAALGGVGLGTIAGVAPHANLIAYDVCGIAGTGRACSGTAILAAIDQAIADGVDIINLSLGSDSKDPWLASDARGLLRAVGAGIFVSASAGNGGPTPGSVGAPANAPWVAAAASATHQRRPANSLRDFAGGDPGLRPAAPLDGLNISASLGRRALIDAAQLSPPNAQCQAFSAGQQAQVAGALVVCQRGGPSPAAKAANAQAAGAAGLVVTNEFGNGENLDAGALPLPGLVIGYSDGLRLRAWLAACADCTALVGGFERRLDPAAADMLDETSARGPDIAVPNLLKPDLTAPGVDILGAGADADPAATDFEQLSGTSMAAPHVGGLAALLRQIHPDWTPAEIRSAMALTAAAARTHTGAPAGPFERGSGRIRALGAALAGFVLDINADAYTAANPALGGDAAALNLPSLVDQGCVGGCVFTRTLRSTLGVPLTWDIATDGAGFTLTTEPAGAITLGPGERKQITIRAAVTAPQAGALGYGAVRFTARGGLAPAAAMPVAIALERSDLPAELTIAAKRRVASQALTVRAMAISELAVSAFGLAPLQPELISLGEDPTPENYRDTLAGGIYQQILSLPAGNLRFLAQVDRATALDLNLIVYADAAGEGFGSLGPEDSILCQRSGPTADERCDLLAPSLLTGRATALQVTVLVQNVTGSGAARDSFRLLWGRVNADTALGGFAEGAGNLAVAGPAAVPAGQPFDLSIGWALPEARAGDRYIGVLSLGSAPGAPGDLGSTLITLEMGGDRVYLPAVIR